MTCILTPGQIIQFHSCLMAGELESAVLTRWLGGELEKTEGCLYSCHTSYCTECTLQSIQNVLHYRIIMYRTGKCCKGLGFNEPSPRNIYTYILTIFPCYINVVNKVKNYKIYKIAFIDM